MKELEMERMLDQAYEAFIRFRKSSRFVRAQLLQCIAQGISDRRSEFVETIINEARKPKALAEVEVNRAIQTFMIASEEAKRFGGEIIPLDSEASSQEFDPALSTWVPRGVVLAITPFNFPLNLVAHKVAPALAVGASVIVKPPPQAPGAAVLLGEVFDEIQKKEASLQNALQVVQASHEEISHAIRDPRVAVLSFTGSDQVGWMLQEKAYRKKVVLELGGNAGVIVHEDADLKRAASRCAYGGFAYSGQVCISVQRILVHEKIRADFQELFLQEVSKIKSGNPREEGVLVGPLIDQKSADRVFSWIESAQNNGAEVLIGGKREENLIYPTVMTGVSHEHSLWTEEVFGPVVLLESYRDFDEALEKLNSSRYGLQAGVFTKNYPLIQKARDQLEVGCVVINEVPTFRADHMPYGGMKDSGQGREGVRFAMEEFSERKIFVTWRGLTPLA